MHAESYEDIAAKLRNRSRRHSAVRPILQWEPRWFVRSRFCLARRRSKYGSVVCPGKAEARLFITPGFSFRVVNALLTNFHLPKYNRCSRWFAFAAVSDIGSLSHAVGAGSDLQLMGTHADSLS